MKKTGNWFSRHKVLTVIIVIIAVIVAMSLGRSSNSAAGTIEVNPSRRDITTYNSFTGNITPVDEYDIIPKVTASLKSVKVKKGDHVTKGQVLAELDSTTQQNSIAVSKAQLSAAQQSSALQIQSAQNALDNFDNGVYNGWNSSLNSAWNAVTTAQTQLQQAEDALAKAQGNKADAVNSSNDAKNNAKKALDHAQAAYNDYVSSSEYTTYTQNLAVLQKEVEDKTNALNQVITMQNEGSADMTETAGVEASASPSALTSAQQALNDANTALVQFTQSNASIRSKAEQLSTAVTAAQTAYDQASSAADSASDTDLTQLQQAVDSAQAAYFQAQQAYKSAQEAAAEQQQSLQTSVDQAEAAGNNSTSVLQIQQAEDALSDYTIIAPVNGVVTEVNIEEGGLSSGNVDLTSAGNSSGAAIVIADLDTMKVSIKVDEYSIANVRKGSPVTVYIDSLGKSYDGTITYVDDVATNTNGVAYFNADVEFTGDDSVHAGISVEVRLTSADEKNVLSLPVEAVQYRSDNTAYVLVKNGNSQEEKNIEIGASDGSYVEIKSGLNENDIVVYTPAFTYPLQDAMDGGDNS